MKWLITFVIFDLAFMIHLIHNWKTYDDYDKLMVGYIGSLAFAATTLASLVFLNG